MGSHLMQLTHFSLFWWSVAVRQPGLAQAAYLLKNSRWCAGLRWAVADIGVLLAFLLVPGSALMPNLNLH